MDKAQRVAEALVDAGLCFSHRMPELFCGFARDGFLVQCLPDILLSASVGLGRSVALLRSLLRFEPRIPHHELWCSPAIPTRFLPLRVSRVDLGDWHATIDVRDTGWDLTGLDPGVVEVVRRPRPPVVAYTSEGP